MNNHEEFRFYVCKIIDLISGKNFEMILKCSRKARYYENILMTEIILKLISSTFEKKNELKE
jgi:hypothetical protein